MHSAADVFLCGAKEVVITMGCQGAFATEQKPEYYPRIEVEAVDTTGLRVQRRPCDGAV